FRSFGSAVPSVVLARKDGIVLSKPIIRLRIIENLRRFSLFSAQDSSLHCVSLKNDARGVARI
ncbi:MAG: hypothetical protein IKA84_00955, partial [Clostridia bacterium]|nr:hypothetical protein [Clostridia bacterium]